MGYVYMWVEGYDNLHEFCKKRFGEMPQFCETIGHCGSSTIYLTYKPDNDGYYHEMYFIFMKHEKSKMWYYELMDEIFRKYNYEDIRTDRHSILKKG